MDQHQRQSVNELVNRGSMALRFASHDQTYMRHKLYNNILLEESLNVVNRLRQLRAPVRDLVIGNNTAQSLNDDQ
ncbi:hypothetical protein COLO4_34207 [Corchorus olitorius]|uniref:Uncharacterized protein n=1 Tax=Corchorus olitorius TaxID=93759 RepID=A0A1R3GN31_9ROSI|nr:hypothetical protein COLO4_34207 [Corchorus olitorius]